MRLHENIDFTTLTWVKPELDETLRQARNALQNYVEDGESPAELRTCSDLLHQVQGTLRMVELYGAAMVAEEMEQLARALIDSKVDNRDNAYGVLMQGIVQLPDYLERLQSGHRDIPIVLLPLLNQLRESRGEKGLSESVLFSPDLSRPLPPSAQGPQVPMDQSELSRRAEALRGLYQSALLRWLKDDNSPATIRDLTDVCEQLVPITWAEPARRLFWVAAGTLDALAKNAFPISTPLKQALAKVEREIKRLADNGDAAFRTDPPIELTKQLLYFVAHEGSDTGRIGEIRSVFGLSGGQPSESELAHARGSLSGNNRALLETVAIAIKEDLLRVKDALDLHLRTPGASVTELSVQVDSLDRVADTLGMLGLGVPRRVVQDQRSAIDDVITGQRKGNEETLLDIAGALLYVEAALDDQVDRLGKEETQAADSAPPPPDSRRLLEVLIKEAIVNFAEARQCFVGFVETHWDHSQLTEVPRLLTEVSGALRILNMSEPADYLIGVRQFTDNELLRRRQVPNGQQMDRLADALASLEYYLEALRDRRPNREQILDVAKQSLTSLGYWPLSAETNAPAPQAEVAVIEVPPTVAVPNLRELAEAPVVDVPAPAPAAVEPPLVAPAAQAPAPVSAPQPTQPTIPTPVQPASAAPAAAAGDSSFGPIVPGFDGTSSEEIDDEIREVFLEEFDEEIENLAQLLPAWRAAPDNAELLRPIRRVFHTLKGSGRLVGAKTLGEFSFRVETLLNRVLDGSRPASLPVLALVQLSLDKLPLLRQALQGQEVHADLEGIQRVAEQLAAGEEVTYAGGAAPVIDDAVEVVEAVSAEAPVSAQDFDAASADADSAGPVFSIDPVLLEILKPEVAGHLEVVDAWLAQCATRGPQPVNDPLLRSIHTMNGAFAMTEVVMITDVTAPLEGFVKRSLAHQLTPNAEGIALVADAARAIRETIAAIERPRPVLPHFEDLAARAMALRDALPDSVLSSVPAYVDEDASAMPHVVMLEAADVSAIPQFDTASEAATTQNPATDFEIVEDAAQLEAAAQEADARAAAEAEAALTAQLEADARVAAEEEAEAARAAQSEADARAEAEAQAAAVLAAAQEAQAREAEAALAEQREADAKAALAAQREAEAALAAQAEAEAALAAQREADAEAAAALAAQQAEADARAALEAEAEAARIAEQEAEAIAAAQAQFEAEARALAAAEADAEAALAEATFAAQLEADSRATAEAEAMFAAELEAEARATQLDSRAESEALPSDSGEPLLSFDGRVFDAPEDALQADGTAIELAHEAVEAHEAIDASQNGYASAEFVDGTTSDAVEFETDFASSSGGRVETVDAAQADLAGADLHDDEPAVAHAEFPESEMLSLEAFLAQAHGMGSSFVLDEAKFEPATDPSTDAASTIERAEITEVAEATDAAPADALEDVEPAVVASQEIALADGAEDIDLQRDEPVDNGYLAAAPVSPFADSNADESGFADADSALAGMIAAYPADDESAAEEPASDLAHEVTAGTSTEAEPEAEPAPSLFSAEELAGADQILGDSERQARAFEDAPAPEEVIELDVPASAEQADAYYGLSLAELESLTAPESTAPASTPEPVSFEQLDTSRPTGAVEVDGFADLPVITDLPAWSQGREEREAADEAQRVESELLVEESAAGAQAEAQRRDVERLEAERVEAERVAAERVERERLEAERVEAERVEAERIEAERIEAERVEAERIEAERIEAERIEAERLEAERVEAERVEAERIEAERIEAERVEAERIEADRIEADRIEADRMEAERAEAELLASQALVAEQEFADDLQEDELPPAVVAEPQPAELVQQSRPAVPMAVDPADPETALDVSDLDTELLDLFLEESNDILDHSDGMLARLRDRHDDRDSIINLQRDLHTLKGGARMAGIYAVGDLGHAMESLLESVAEGRRKLDATGVVVLERGFDRLHGMVARIGERKSIALPAGLIAQVEALSEGKSIDTLDIAMTEAPAADAKPSVETKGSAATPATVGMDALSAPVDDLGGDDDLMTGVRAPQEQVRIRADLLDRLVNYAGEVAIYRARLEQQLGAFRANLGELDQTTTRLREQLRRLDIETEAQIVARYQREGESNDESFDPLELDRFTNQQQLTRGLNESANDLVNLQGVLDELTRQYETLLLQQSRVSSDLQEGLMRTRMVPFDALVPRLRRVLRQAATDTGKMVQLKVDGASGEMDRNVLDRMTAPLEHMLRNAMAHGLELPDERRKARKPEEGVVRIAVQREGSEVVLKVTDDGRGLNKDAIRRKALERGLIKPDAEMSDEALYALILESGFSTAETVSRLSGRGVGMDVVYSEIRQLGGTLQIRSVEGKGSEFIIRLPFTLAVTQAVFVKIGDTSFAVPIASVQGVGRIARADLEKQLATETPVFNYAGEDYAIHDLGNLIGHAPAKAQDSLQMPLLLARSGDLRTAISIDQVLGSREIVVKPVGPQVNSVPGIFGATIMGDGRVVVILDVAPLVRRHIAMARDATPVVPVPVVAAHRVPIVMVVDDSITMRKVTGRVLERNNMEVMTAKDGVDAVEKMAERVPDLVLLDIEMPRMDGYEVAQNMRSDPRLKDVPIIMITSRTGDKHRQRAMEIGVNRYLGKPYQEPELMRNVFEMLGLEAVNG